MATKAYSRPALTAMTTTTAITDTNGLSSSGRFDSSGRTAGETSSDTGFTAAIAISVMPMATSPTSMSRRRGIVRP